MRQSDERNESKEHHRLTSRDSGANNISRFDRLESLQYQLYELAESVRSLNSVINTTEPNAMDNMVN